jgi:hypothetical protein
MATLFSDPVPYSAIVDRPPLRLPDNARVALWVIVNVEHWSADGAMPRVVIPPPMHHPCCPTALWQAIVYCAVHRISRNGWPKSF